MYKETKIFREGKSDRLISSPGPVLKFIQRRIHRRILEQISIDESAHGFVRGRSIFSAANPHSNHRIVICLDLRDFFPSITSNRVYGMFKAYGFNQKIAAQLTALCCNNGSLPQGAPTSPMISNIICKKLDKRLRALMYKYSGNYTRYADDLIFSGEESISKLVPIIKHIIIDEGFELANEKFRMMRSGSRQRVLGLNVNHTVTVPKKARRLLRAMIHNQSLIEEKDYDFISYLRGHLAFISSAHPEQARNLKTKLLGHQT
jgi:RNA-directed DNA polymerase